MPKLLQLNVTANWGSTGKIAEGIGKAALSSGWESYIAYGRMMNPSQSELLNFNNRADVMLHYARGKFLDSEGLGSKAATRRLIHAIESLSPEIVQLHNIHDHWLNYPILFKFLAESGIQVVWTFHDCWAFTGGCFHFENNACYEWRHGQCLKCEFGHPKSARNFGFRYNLLKRIGSKLHIVGVSRWIEKYARESFLGDIGAGFSVVNNGIDVNGVFQPRKDEPKNRMILGVSNVWPEYKGLGDFIKLRERLPEDVDICLVGLSEDQVKSLPSGIKGMTRTSSADELADIYRSAMVFVNPTRNDSFPTVNLEALACGTPVITYRTGGSPEAIDDKTGLVVEKGDIDALEAAILKVLDNPNMFTVSDCRSRAVANFDKDVQFGKYIDLYNSLLSGN